jgi:hypothetical protein
MPASNLFWIALVVVNLSIQILSFLHDGNRLLHWAKKITTPLLLFSAFLIVWVHAGTAFSVASIILLAMGVGEIGIEGSSVVTAQGEPATALDRWSVTVAGLLFVGVNVFLGAVLLARVDSTFPIAVGFLAGAGMVASMLGLVLGFSRPEKTVRTQMLLYSPGLVVLAAGAIAALFGPVSRLGIAAIILTASDSMVLIRMGANLDKARPRDERILLILMLSILLLYYAYMGVLISTGSPFTR